jgi:hypothetical protein
MGSKLWWNGDSWFYLYPVNWWKSFASYASTKGLDLWRLDNSSCHDERSHRYTYSIFNANLECKLSFDLYLHEQCWILRITWTGLTWFAIMDKVDSALAADLGVGLECVKGNLINFVFAALILGLTCTRTTSHHTSLRAVITSLLHEGNSI